MEQNKSSIGSIIGTIIIIALIILGGLYFWGKRIEESKATQSAMTDTEAGITTPEQNEATVIKSMSSSDDVSSIETDLQKTNTTNLDTELNAQ